MISPHRKSEKINYRYLYDFILFNSQLLTIGLQCDTEKKLLIETLAKAYFDGKDFEKEELLRNYLKIILIRLEQKTSFNWQGERRSCSNI